MKTIPEGAVFIISGPSGAGKSTLRKILAKSIPNLYYSVSWTTRPPRPGEVNGREYVFVEETFFKELMAKQGFLEWAFVHGYYYGTPKAEVERQLSEGTDVILEIDVQGALMVKQRHPAAVLIFVMPPSKEDLLKRLTKRKSETSEQISLRIHNAEEEISCSRRYDYSIINDKVEKAGRDLVNLVKSIQAQRKVEQ